MPSSTAALSNSRSPSPQTPEPSDPIQPVAIQSELDFASSWFLSMHPTPIQGHWGPDNPLYQAPQKPLEDQQMLRLDDLIEQDAYEDSPSPSFASSSGHSSPPAQNMDTISDPSRSPPPLQNFQPNNLVVPSHNGPISLTKPIPPPASLPRKHDPSTLNQRVVHPPREACYNLPIMFPSIPEGGAKSRVETQVRVTVDLTDPSSSTDPYKYDRIGSWKWLRLPQGTATKKRTRKQGKIDPDPEDVLQLSVSVTCASPPHNRVLSCSSCQAREAKRVAKKLAARVRPARSDSESGEEGNKIGRKQHEDTTNIIQFNCAEILDFSTGSVVLPLRITCYCRHHREKVGFNVHFTMTDHAGRLIGSGMSKPIMITDDHKTTGSSNNRSAELVAGFSGLPIPEWTQESLHCQIPPIDTKAPSKRKKDSIVNVNGKSRPKPYDAANKSKKGSREGSVSSVPSPATSYSSLPTTRSPTPSILQNLISQEVPHAFSQPPPLQVSTQSSETSSPDSLATPLDHNSDVFIADLPQPLPQQELLQSISQQQASQSHGAPTIPMNVPSMMIPPQAHAMPFLLFDPNQSSQSLQLQLPIIHRLIPNAGPTHGGIEVTILGANFHPSLQLNCIFGDTAASSTQRWSDNTLVCLLPPRAVPGVVAVWFDGFPKIDDPLTSPPSLFTYSDESDRALMELALQVVGLKMTGKIEDAKNVAMRIVGTAGSDNSGPQGDNSNMMQMASFPSTRDLRPLLFTRAHESSDFENLIIDFLSVVDTPLDGTAPSSIPTAQAISYPSTNGQTLLHLATFLGLTSLVKFLLDHDIDIDARDRNGYTALHFAALTKSAECAKVLLEAGADREIVNSLGKTPQEIAPSDFFGDLIPAHHSDTDSEESDDEEAEWGDGEEDAGEELRRIALRRRASQRALRKSAPASARHSVNVSRAMTPPPLAPPPTTLVDTAEQTDLKQADEGPGLDEKQTASFMEKMIQRTLAQLPAPQGIIPNIAQLPLPHLPDLPGVPWGALHQMEFPVFVPVMPAWPSFLGGENHPADAANGEGAQQGDRKVGAAAIRAAQEWRATWEKWVALAVATTARQQQTEELPPPVYTAEPAEGEIIQTSSAVDGSKEASTSSSRHPVAEIRPVGYDSNTTVPEREVEAFAYQPAVKQKQKARKNDRMLLLFWLPILLLSMVWALHNGARFAFETIKTILPSRGAILA